MQTAGKGEAEVERKGAWPLQDPWRAGPRRDGRGVPRHRPADRARGRAEDAAARPARGGDGRGAGALPARSALRRSAQSPQHRHHPRRGRAGRRRLYRDGAAQGPLPEADPQEPAANPAADHRRPGRADRRRARARAQVLDRASRREAGERDGRGIGALQADRLRRRLRALLDDDADRRRARLAEVHVARAGARPEERSALRRVLPRQRALRDAHRRLAVRAAGRHLGVPDHEPHRRRAASPAALARAAAPRRVRAHRRPRAREQPRAALPARRLGAVEMLRKQGALQPRREDPAAARAKAMAKLDQDLRAATQYLAAFAKELNDMAPATSAPYDFLYLGRVAAATLSEAWCDSRPRRIEGKDYCEHVLLRFRVSPQPPARVTLQTADIPRFEQYLKAMKAVYDLRVDARSDFGEATRATFSVRSGLLCEVEIRADYEALAVTIDVTNVRRIGKVRGRIPAAAVSEMADELARYALGVDSEFAKRLTAV